VGVLYCPNVFASQDLWVFFKLIIERLMSLRAVVCLRGALVRAAAYRSDDPYVMDLNPTVERGYRSFG
jgi:hypothetical protein